MADIGSGEEVGLFAKAGGASVAGAIWGLFVTALVVIPAAIGTLLMPFAKKTNEKITEKLGEVTASSKKESKPLKMTRSEKEHQARMQRLDEQREEEMLREKLASLQNRKKAKSKSRSASVTV
jgi:hypothetical protein